MADFVAFANADDARLVLSLARRLRASGLLDNLNLPSEDRPIEQPIYVENASGETIPPFAVMQATGVVGDENRDFYTVEKVSDPTGSSGPLLFNGVSEIESNGIGIAQSGQAIYHNPDNPVSGFRNYAPSTGSWSLGLQLGGPYMLAPRTGADSGQGYAAKIIRQQAVLFSYYGRIAGGAGTSGTANIAWLGSTQTLITKTVYDTQLIFDSATPPDQGYCVLQGNEFFAIQAKC